MFFKNIIFLSILFMTYSCGNISMELDKKNPIDTTPIGLNNAPVTSNFVAVSFNEDTQTIITLTYTDAESDDAVSCDITVLVNITETQACSCTAGVCTVGVTGIANYSGAISFDYTVSDTHSSNSSTVSSTINPVNDLPVISGTPLSFSTDRNITYNGTFTATDVESDPLTFSLVSAASNGTATVNTNGTYSYAPNGSYSGADSFQIKVNDGFGDSSTVTVSVTVTTTLTCPTNYKKIASNATLGTSEFCVMDFEAKDQSNGRAYSLPAGTPWVNITPTSAKTACQANGAGYDQISNREWMAIAYLIEGRAENWSSGIVGTGHLNRGHTDSSSALLSVSDTTNHYNQTGNSAVSGWEQRRTFYISATDFIWDFSGNAWSWVDWTTGGAFDKGFTSCGSDAWYEMFEVASNCASPSVLNYRPNNPAGNNAATYGSSFNLGNLYGTSNASFGAALRGGHYGDGGNAGIYSMALDSTSTDFAFNIGFRCVFR